MNDKEFLEWLRDRLHYQHGENLNVDYMLKLQSIIDSTPPDKLTPNISKSIRSTLDSEQNRIEKNHEIWKLSH